MELKRDAYCGLYCGACPVFLARKGVPEEADCGRYGTKSFMNVETKRKLVDEVLGFIRSEKVLRIQEQLSRDVLVISDFEDAKKLA